jgi:23S rRNA (adenine2503-C2)-methyltransferase
VEVTRTVNLAEPTTMTLADHNVESFAGLMSGAGHRAVHAARALGEFYRADGRPDWVGLQVSASLRQWLAERLASPAAQVLDRRVAADGTVKMLLGFPAGGAVEAVLMPAYRSGRAMGCVSSQIGCAMGCDFCASTRGGLERNLSSGEIVQQFLFLRREAAALGRKLTSLVFMGMGEPMHNLDNVLPAIERIAHPALGALGWRQVTVSTVGVVPGIDRLADADLNVHLALSLHAPDDETRSRLVPANRRYPVARIVAAARRFLDKTGRIPTIEYCLLAGVNDSNAHAGVLSRLLEGFRAHVNLIPYNPIGAGISGRVYGRPARERVISFLAVLREAGTVAHVRDTRGDDVNAACGQLRQRRGDWGSPLLVPSPGIPGGLGGGSYAAKRQKCPSPPPSPPLPEYRERE